MSTLGDDITRLLWVYIRGVVKQLFVEDHEENAVFLGTEVGKT